MSVILQCSHPQEVQPYIGVDPSCDKPAIFCIQHNPHHSKDGLLHQMMPLPHFRRSINQRKFKMADKVGVLTDQYSAFMDQLIQEITQLKLRKVVELSMLWLRELASNQDQYENLRKLYRNDYEGLTCKDIHWLYHKMANNDKLEHQKLQEIECYKEICKVMATLQSSVKTRLIISEKIGELQGVVQKGELLRRALPDRKILKENTKEILLQALDSTGIELKYNKITLKANSRNFRSIFSKYPLIEHTNYHLLINTKYSNILIGICDQKLKKSTDQINDLHYSQHSITFNCSNGCLYRDGMFESGSAHLTKGVKQLELILRVTDAELLILIGKNVVCRTNIESFKKEKLYLHMLMRTQGDCIQIDRDKYAVQEELKSLIEPTKNTVTIMVDQEVMSSPKISIDGGFGSKPTISEGQSLPQMVMHMPIRETKKRAETAFIEASPMIESLFQKKKEDNSEPNSSVNLLQSVGLKKSIPLNNSLQRRDQQNRRSNTLRSGERSKVIIEMENSMMASQAEQAESRYASNYYDQINEHRQPYEKESLINPAIMLPLKKSQFEISLRSSLYDGSPITMSPLPSAKVLMKKASGLTNTLNGIKNTQTQIEEDWI